MEEKAEQVIKKRRHEYVRDTFILIIVLAVIVAGIALTIHYLVKQPASITICDENGQPIGNYSKEGDVEIPIKKGYSSSWVSESGATYDSIEAALQNNETSIKQVFSLNTYTFTLYLVGGELAEDFGYEYHEADPENPSLGAFYTKTFTVLDNNFDLPAIKEKEKDQALKKGCTFAYWTSINYIGTTYNVDNLKATEVKTFKTEVASDFACYATWKENIAGIFVFGEDGHLLFYEEQKQTSLISKEAFEERVLSLAPEGFDFIGFCSDSSLSTPFDFTHELDKEVISIYTKWDAHSYSLTFKDTNGDTLQSTSLKTNEAIDYFDYTSFLAPGKQLDGWTFNDALFTQTKMPAKDVVLYPSISNIPYTITWIADNDQTTQICFYGNEPLAPSTLDTSKAEDIGHTYEFDGWSPSLTSVTGDKTYTAQYRTVTKTFTYSIEQNGAELVPPTTAEYDTSIAYPSNPASYEQDGYYYTFVKWVLKGTDTQAPTNVTQDMVIEALFSKAKCSYQVKWFDKDGNIIQVENDQHVLVDYLTIEYEDSINLNLARSGAVDEYVAQVNGINRTHTFIGWTINNILQTSDTYTVVGNTNIYAKYEINGDKSTYVLNDENGNLITEEQYFVEDYASAFNTISGIERSKAADNTYTYTFEGWGYYVGQELTMLTSADQLNIGANATIELKEVYSKTPIPYTITWDLNNGEENATVAVTYTYGQTLDPAANLEAASKTAAKASTAQYEYEFTGWKTYTSDGWVNYQEGDTVTKNATYVAQYEAHIRTYTYKFYVDSALVKESTIEYNYTIVAPANPTKTATAQYTYTFDGWYIDVTDSSTKFTEGTQITSNVTYIAKFNATVNQYTYKFYDGINENPIKEVTADYGTVIAPPADPSKEQTIQYTYAFSGWVIVGTNTALENDQQLVGDISFIATYEESLRLYDYTFYNGSATVASGQKGYGLELDISTLNIEAPTKADDEDMYTYTFAGWSLNSNLVTAPVTITSDVEFYAEFEQHPIEHTYTFVTGEGATTIDPITVGYGLPVTAPSNPTRAHYTFTGWDQTIPSTMGTENLEFVASWEEVVYHVTYKDGNSTVTTANIKEFTISTQASALELDNDATKTGYTLQGWEYNNNSITAIEVYEDLVIYAVFTPNEYIITYNGNGAVLDPNTKTVIYDSTYGTLPTPTKHGYDFAGWYLDSACTTSPITSTTTVKITSDTNVYAKWTYTPYYVYGYIGTTKVAQFYFDIDHAATLTDYENEAYDFDAWYLQNIYDASVAVSSFTSINSYSNIDDADENGIIKVYALVKSKALTISGNKVTEYTGTASHVIIPRVWGGNEITIIGANAFNDNDTIESVDTKFITEIQSNAFDFCINLTTIDLSNVVTIGSEAFLNCFALTSVDLSSAETIGQKAFLSSGINEVTLSDNLTTLGNYAFYGCNITTLNYIGSNQAAFVELVNGTKGNSSLLV